MLSITKGEALTIARFDPGFYEVAEIFAPVT